MNSRAEQLLENYLTDTLIEDLNIARKTIAKLEYREDLRPHELRDLDDASSLSKSLQIVLAYYLPYDEYKKRVGVYRTGNERNYYD